MRAAERKIETARAARVMGEESRRIGAESRRLIHLLHGVNFAERPLG
jgi:hypothetical protein